MKILITSPSLNEDENVSGISSLLRAIIDNTHNKYEHFVAGRKDGETFGFKWLTKQFQLPFQFFTTIRAEQPDVVHINTSMVPLAILRDLGLSAAARLTRRPIVIHVHGGQIGETGFGNRMISFLARRLLGMASLVITLSGRESERLLHNSPTIQTRILPNAISLNEIPQRNTPEKATTIIFLGRLHPSKGLDDIVHVCEMLRTRGQEFSFYCFGSGPQQEEFVDHMSAILGDHFRFGGVVRGEEKWRALSASDIFLLPSKYEGLPIALLEAMAAGCVPVVSSVGSIPDIVKDGINGYLVDAGNIEQIAEKVILLLTDHETFRNMSLNAQAIIRERYDIHEYVRRLDECYAEAIGQN